MGIYTGAKEKVRIDGETYTVKRLAEKLGISPLAAKRRYLHRVERGMEISIRVLAKSLNGTPKKLLKPRPLNPLSARIREHMQKQGRSIAELAAYMKVVNSSVSRMLCRGRDLPPKRLEQICDWLMLTEEEEHELNILAAREHGWKV